MNVWIKIRSQCAPDRAQDTVLVGTDSSRRERSDGVVQHPSMQPACLYFNGPFPTEYDRSVDYLLAVLGPGIG